MRFSLVRLLSLVLLSLSFSICVFAASPVKVDFKNAGIVHVDNALSFEGIVESTGHNDGLQIEQFQKFVNLKKGDPYCAAFVSYVLDKSHVSYPDIRTGLAVRFITNRSIAVSKILSGASKIPPGAIFIMNQDGQWKGHTGLITGYSGNSVSTIEANTSPQPGTAESDRDGQGIFERKRQLIPGNFFSIKFLTPVEYSATHKVST